MYEVTKYHRLTNWQLTRATQNTNNLIKSTIFHADQEKIYEADIIHSVFIFKAFGFI